MRKRKILAWTITVALIVMVTVAGALAADNNRGDLSYQITDEIKAAEVCAEHLDAECTLCEDGETRNSYYVLCPHCGTRTTVCCSCVCAIDDAYTNCLVYSHPEGCHTVKDFYWNDYICMNCGWYTRGTHADDYHTEAYWHLYDPTCYDHAYCSLPKLRDLKAIVNARLGLSTGNATDESGAASTGNPVKDPVAAADYCEVHGIFACDIPHNGVS